MDRLERFIGDFLQLPGEVDFVGVADGIGVDQTAAGGEELAAMLLVTREDALGRLEEAVDAGGLSQS